MRVLIVDDEEVLRDVLEVVLRREGFDTVTAASGEEALSMLDGEEVDLVILDVMLQIGRASCRERVYISGAVAPSATKRCRSARRWSGSRGRPVQARLPPPGGSRGP